MGRVTKDAAVEAGARALEQAAQAMPTRTHAELARQLAVSQGRLNNWKRRGVPIQVCPEVARRSNGLLTEHALRPDFFDPPADSQRGAA